MTKIIPITKATRDIKPPLKKSELVEALAIRELQTFRIDQAAIQKQIETTRSALYSESIVEVVRTQGKPDKYRDDEPFRIMTIYAGDQRVASKVEVNFILEATPEVKRLYRELSKLEKRRINIEPSIYDLKRKISAAMSERSPAGDRVTELLNNPETSKALDETLEALKKPLQLAIA